MPKIRLQLGQVLVAALDSAVLLHNFCESFFTWESLTNRYQRAIRPAESKRAKPVDRPSVSINLVGIEEAAVERQAHMTASMLCIQHALQPFVAKSKIPWLFRRRIQ